MHRLISLGSRSAKVFKICSLRKFFQPEAGPSSTEKFLSLSPMQTIGIISLFKTAFNFLFTTLSDSPNFHLLSECPIITYLTPSCLNIGPDTSPVRATLSSIDMSCAPSSALCSKCDVFKIFPTSSVKTKDGQNTRLNFLVSDKEPRYSSTESKISTASARDWGLIFQLAIISFFFIVIFLKLSVFYP